MRARWLGWAGLELEAAGERVVIDPLLDAGAVFAAFGRAAEGIELPAVVPASPGALAGLVTHLHRDHADAGALRDALTAGAPVFAPRAGGGGPLEELGTAQAAHELAAAGLALTEVEPWTTRTVGPFELTALPAVDGTGDPQVSWLVAADGQRVLHAGDTLWHAAWWRVAHRYGPVDVAFLPVNGARVDFPHRQPAADLPAVMTPEQAAAAALALRAGLAVPIHVTGYDFAPHYRPVDGAAAAFSAAAAAAGVAVRELAVGDGFDVPRS